MIFQIDPRGLICSAGNRWVIIIASFNGTVSRRMVRPVRVRTPIMVNAIV